MLVRDFELCFSQEPADLRVQRAKVAAAIARVQGKLAVGPAQVALDTGIPKDARSAVNTAQPMHTPWAPLMVVGG